MLWVLAETIRRITLLVQPFMPGSTAKILDQLAVKDRSFAAFDGDQVCEGAANLNADAHALRSRVEEP